MFKRKTFNRKEEKGAVVLEAAIALPFLLYVCLMGIELTRQSELLLAKRDITRVLALTHICAFRQSRTDSKVSLPGLEPSHDCFQRTISRTLDFTATRFPGVQVYVQTFLVEDPSTPGSENATRLSGLNSCALSHVPARKIAESEVPSGFQSRVNVQDSHLKEQLCLNGILTTAEFTLNRPPLFSFFLEGLGISPGSSQAVAHYEVGVI